jgi:hypothetical protein
MSPLETLNAIPASAAILPGRRLPVLGDRPGIEQCQRVVQSPVLRPGFLAPAGHVENEAEAFPTNFFDRGIAGRDASSVDVDREDAPLLAAVPRAGRIWSPTVRSAAPKARPGPVAGAFLPVSWRAHRIMVVLLVDVGGLQLGRQQLNRGQRQQVGGAGHQERDHVTACPLQGVAHDGGDQHASDRACHTTHANH